MDKQYRTFSEFYPYYLREHSHPINRMLHITGTALLIICVVMACITSLWWLLILVPLIGYGFAWAGHFFIEKNKPATFTYPLFSLASDFVMFGHFLTGQLKQKMREAEAGKQSSFKQNTENTFNH